MKRTKKITLWGMLFTLAAVVLIAAGFPSSAAAAQKKSKATVTSVECGQPGEIALNLKVAGDEGVSHSYQIAVAQNADFTKWYDTLLVECDEQDKNPVVISDKNYLYGEELNKGGTFYIRVREQFTEHRQGYSYSAWSAVMSCEVTAKEISGATGDYRNSGYEVKIKDCKNVDSRQIGLTLQFPQRYDDEEGNNYYCEIYRGTSESNLSLYETCETEFPHCKGTPWQMWTETGPAEWYAPGNNGKMMFYVSTSDHDYLRLTGTVTCFDNSATFGETYYYQIVVKKLYGETVDDPGMIIAKSNIASAKSNLFTPDLIQAYSKSNTAAKIAWTQEKYAHGYQVFRKTSGEKWKKVKTIKNNKTTSLKQKKLKSGKTYLYRVRAYRKVNGKMVYSNYSDSVKIRMKNPAVKGSYSKKGSVYGPSLSKAKLAEVRRVVQGFKDNFISSKSSAADKARTAYIYINLNCQYAERGYQYNNANSAWGALVYGEAQCSGYARGYKALCDAIGVPCRYVHASNTDHQWTMVKIKKKWYIVDPQGGYFLVGSDTYKMTGMKWNTKGLPKCSKSDYKAPKSR